MTAETLNEGTYEVLRARLGAQAKELAERAEALNTRRIATFGARQMRLMGTERIRTENNCVPRDIAQAGETMLFGYNVFVGLRAQTAVADVFAVHGRDFEPVAKPGLLDDPGFERDFAELYRYYRQTRLLQLRRLEDLLLAVFQTGARPDDLKVLRWRVALDGSVQYIDNRGERDHVFPPAFDFEWTPTTREQHVLGRHPHVSIEDEVFVETVGGNLTVKVENNTEDGEGIYSEPVDEPLQSLADAEIAYAKAGPLILIRVLPYKEEQHRFLVFNTRTREVRRLDGIGQACRRLPDDQGIIFPGGYHLATGAARTFDADTTGLEFERVVRSVNGEDVLYVFHARAAGRYLLLPYNVIRKEVATPITCHGYSLFDDGTLVAFRHDSDEPARVHPMQVWQTPYVSDTFAAAQPVGAGPLDRIGNADLVRGIADALSVTRMIEEMTPAGPVFEAIIAACTRLFDNYHWLGEADLQDLAGPVGEVRSTAGQVLDEFESVQALTAQAAAAVEEAATESASLIRLARGDSPAGTDAWIAQLTALRQAQGRAVTLRELRYADLPRLDGLEAELGREIEAAARRAVEFLRREDAFAGYQESVERLAGEAAEITTVAAATPIAERLAEQADGLQVVTEVVGGLEISDATVRIGILRRIGEVLGGVNRVRAVLDGRRRELAAAEGRAAFAAEFALLTQSVTAALAAAGTPERCDEQLAQLMLQIEALESRFGEFDDFAEQLAGKRSEVADAFAARRQGLLDERARRAERLVASARRTLASVQRRAAALSTIDEVNTYFATDPMVQRLRTVTAELRTLGDSVRAEELEGRAKAARQEAGRSLRDRLDLYGAGGTTIRLGRHTFAVNTQAADLTLVPDGAELAYTITGTDYRAPVRDAAFIAATRPFWDQPLISESPALSRAEQLATAIFAADPAAAAAALTDDSLPDLVRVNAENRLDEGYERGVHDADATQILGALIRLGAAAGLLRFTPSVRVAAQLFWAFEAGDEQRAAWALRASSLVRARSMFGATEALHELAAELNAAAGATDAGSGGGAMGPVRDGGTIGAVRDGGTIGAVRDGGTIGAVRAIGVIGAGRDGGTIGAGTRVGGGGIAGGAGGVGEYLVEELAAPTAGFVTRVEARALLDRFHRAISATESGYRNDLRSLPSVGARRQLITAWLSAFAAAQPGNGSAGDLADDLAEAVAIELTGTELTRYDSAAALTETVSGLLSVHPRIVQGRLDVRLDRLLEESARFRATRMPAFRAYQKKRTALAAAERDRLRLDDHRPGVLSSFVRNRLVDEVYLPLIGDNLARQVGATDDAKRTDQSGLLLLISPPGYGKTTLMEYVANRLGLLLVKVNGPALGHAVTSLDPAEAPNATARQEVEKISFALELGTNVLLYLDDIQHTSPELLQKFIALCDAQRQMDGVWEGETRTYNLRGKRFAVCMAGNPYTESGQRFRIPDMLANRADVWNLGDVLAGREEAFALSYLENALTSNPVVAPLAARDHDDLPLLARLAEGDDSVRPDRLKHAYSAADLNQILPVLRAMRRVQRLVVRVNQAYVESAAQSEAARTEPPFRLQGSYRTMNKLTERIVPAMNDAELEDLIDDHYRGEAQTLTGGAEANLLKLAELRGRLSAEQAARWAAVREAYVKEKALGGSGDDPMGRAVGAVGLLADQVRGVREAIRSHSALGG